ncbi:MAG: IS5 family transposase [Acidobacteriota bacterium]|nr:IS5 family transposase [Acidobacteriota bacterium]
MKQSTFASLSFDSKKKPTRREKFLGEMERVVPWDALLALIEPHYPKAGRRGRPPMAVMTMLRIHFLQQWYALSDPAMEDALYEIESMRRFVGLELNEDAIPDETTILKFRRFLETHALAPKLLAAVNGYLGDKGLLLRQGTIVDATIIHAPSSTKNRNKTRDPQMHQTRKGNQWYFGMKAHIGVDVESGLVHTVTTTAANVADVTETSKLLHGEEKSVHGDAGYTGADKREEMKRCKARWHIAAKRGTVKAMPDDAVKEATQALETIKAAIRARVEHPFRVIKRQFGYQKVRFKGLAKNTAQVLTLFALSNLWMARRALMAQT